MRSFSIFIINCYTLFFQLKSYQTSYNNLLSIIGTVKLVVRYTPRILEEMEARFDKQKARRRQLS